jgi:hypothetical protein
VTRNHQRTRRVSWTTNPLSLGLEAIGGVAAGFVALGGAAFGWAAALGGLAVAREVALGGAAMGAHVSVLKLARWLGLLVLIPLIIGLRSARDAPPASRPPDP